MTTTALDRAGTDADADAAPASRRGAHVRLLRKIGVGIAGAALIVAGVAMLVLPGPGIVAILAGLGLLGTEFPTARRISAGVNGHARAAWHRIRGGASRLRRKG